MIRVVNSKERIAMSTQEHFQHFVRNSVRSPWALTGAMATAFALAGCGDLPDGEEVPGASKPEITESSGKALVVSQSYPPTPSSIWSAQVIDQFVVELPNWRIHNNGCWLSCSVDLRIRAYSHLNNAPLFDIKGQYNGPDGRDYDWQGKEAVFQIERKPNECFTINMYASHNLNNNTDVFQTYCWKPDRMTWALEGGNAPIGVEQSVYQKTRVDFSTTFRYRINWDMTSMEGSLIQNQGNALDGDEWHHLPIVMWGNPSFVVSTLSVYQGDADLYTSTGDRPSLGSYSCRPYSSGLSLEYCQHATTGLGRIWASVHNYRSDVQSKYRLIIKPTY